MQKPLNWRHDDYEIPGSWNVTGTGVLLCTIFYGGWGMSSEVNPFFASMGIAALPSPNTK